MAWGTEVVALFALHRFIYIYHMLLFITHPNPDPQGNLVRYQLKQRLTIVREKQLVDLAEIDVFQSFY